MIWNSYIVRIRIIYNPGNHGLTVEQKKGDLEMTAAVKQGNSISRRSILKAAAATVVIGSVGTRAFGEGNKELSLWTTQSAPEQKAAFNAAAQSFVEQNPGYKVVIQTMAEEEILPKLATSLAARTPPSVIANIPPEFVMQLDQQGLVEPLDDVLQSIGEDDYLPNLVDLMRNPETKKVAGLPYIVSTTSGALWYRKDLIEESGVELPGDWDSFVLAAKQLTKDGVFGTVYPCGKNNMAEKLFLQSIWQSGGFVVDPDLNVSLEDRPVIQALEFAKEILAFSPPNANSYGYYETVNGFVQGRLATAPMRGVCFPISKRKTRDCPARLVLWVTRIQKAGWKSIPVTTIQWWCRSALLTWMAQRS